MIWPSEMLRRKRRAGFVLLDTLMAFAIAALALTLVLGTLPSVAVRHADRIHLYQVTELAHSVLTEYRVTFPEMQRDGEDPSGWSWSVTERPSDEAPVIDEVGPIVFVEVSVTAWHKDRPDLRVTTKALVARRTE